MHITIFLTSPAPNSHAGDSVEISPLVVLRTSGPSVLLEVWSATVHSRSNSTVIICRKPVEERLQSATSLSLYLRWLEVSAVVCVDLVGGRIDN